MKKIAIYVRVSTNKQEVQNQLTPLREYCKRKEYEIFEEYIDVISGSKDKRPGFDKMFLDAHKRLFDIILFWDLSRFSRAGTLFTLQKIKELDNLGIGWISYSEPYFNSMGDFKDIIISIMATLHKLEREKLSERTKLGLVGKKNVGKRGRDKKPRKYRKDKGIKRKKRGV